MEDRPLTFEARAAAERLRALGRWYGARPAPIAAETIDALVAADDELAAAARLARVALAGEVERRAGPFEARLLTALLDVPRERFVLPDDIGASALDTPLLLDDAGLATISAPHAYLLSFRALRLAPGSHLVELGSGSGYGAALASHVVGAGGSVVTVEIDEALAARAARLLAPYANVRTHHADAMTAEALWAGSPRVIATFAVASLPEAWLAALPEGGRLVAPVGQEDAQRLLCVDRVRGQLVWTDHGAVRYVPDRSPTRGVSARMSG